MEHLLESGTVFRGPGDPMTSVGSQRRAGANEPLVAVLVAALPGSAGVDLTMASLDALVAEGHSIEVVQVHDSTGVTWVKALSCTSAPLVAYVEAGLIPSAAWLGEVERAIARHPHQGVVAAQVVDAATGAPRTRPGGVAFTGHPLAPVDAPASVVRTAVLGRAWVARRDRLERAGGFDDLTAIPYGLVDLAWRLWLHAGGAVFDPGLVIRDGADLPGAADRPGAGVEPSGDTEGERAARAVVARERDALATIYRNLDERDLAVALPAARALSPIRLGLSADVEVDAGVGAFDLLRPQLEHERRRRQRARRRPDAEVVAVFGDPLMADTHSPSFLEAHDATVIGLGEDHAFGGRYRVAVITADALSSRMAGPGIRALRIAERLAGEHHVRLASMTVAELDGLDFELSVVDPEGIAALVEWCDVVVFQGWALAGNPAFGRTDRIFLVDVYDPMHLEQLEQARDEGEQGRLDAVRRATAVLNDQLLRGDAFLCASDKQRDLWLGHLASLGRVNPAVYDEDPTLESLITVVPFGISDDPPERTRAALKGVVPGIGVDDSVVLWGGGVYNWFDPLTLVHAIDRLRRRRDDVRLVFLGMRHPNPDIPEMQMAVETRRLAEELGLTGTHVFFNEEWVPYDERQNFLLDADVAVTTHLHHVETDFSFRTRVLDYFWANVPTVATSGDALAELIEHRGLGLTVPPGDVVALEEALFRLIDDDAFRTDCRANVAEVVPDFVWSNALEPVAKFCRSPRRAADLVEEIVQTGPYMRTEEILVQGGFRRDLHLAIDYMREGGPSMVAAKMRDRLARR